MAMLQLVDGQKGLKVREYSSSKKMITVLKSPTYSWTWTLYFIYFMEKLESDKFTPDGVNLLQVGNG